MFVCWIVLTNRFEANICLQFTLQLCINQSADSLLFTEKSENVTISSTEGTKNQHPSNTKMHRTNLCTTAACHQGKPGNPTCASLLKDVWAIQRSKTRSGSTGIVSATDPKGPPPLSAIHAPKRATSASALVSSKYSLAGPPYFLKNVKGGLHNRSRCPDWRTPYSANK